MATSGGQTGSHPGHRLEVYASLREPRTPSAEPTGSASGWRHPKNSRSAFLRIELVCWGDAVIPISSPDRALVRGEVRDSDPAAAARLAIDSIRCSHTDRRTDRFGQNPCSISLCIGSDLSGWD